MTNKVKKSPFTKCRY